MIDTLETGNRKVFKLQNKALGALIAVNALWGLSFPIMKSLNLQLDHEFGNQASAIDAQLAFSSGMIGLRFFFAFLVLCVICPSLVKNASKLEWKAGMIVGLFFYAGLVLQVIGLATIPASRSGFLTSLTAVFTPVFAAILFRQIPAWNVVVGSLIALLGVSVLTGLIVVDRNGFSVASEATSRWTFGDSLTTLGSMLFTGQILFLDHFGKRVNSSAITPGMFLIVVLFASVTFAGVVSPGSIQYPNGDRVLVTQWAPIFLSPMFLVLLFFLSVFCSVFAFLWMNRYQPFVSPVQASVVYSTEPVFASLWALVLPETLALLHVRFGYANEAITWHLLLGGVLILIANIVALWPAKSTRPSPI